MTGPQSILLRAHSGPDVGMGHVMRTRAVARACLRAGAAPVLVVDDEYTGDHLRGEPYDVRLAAAEDPDTPYRAIWLDGFLPWGHELDQARRAGARVFLVENRVADRERAERVVYPALHFVPDAWDRAHPERLLSGASAVPLDDDVLRAAVPRERDVELLVTFGGADPNRLTERVLPLLEGRAGHVVVGVGHHMADRAADLADRARDLEHPGLRVTLLAPGTRLAPWMARARTALTALGTTLYELAYLGVPAWILANYEEDREALAWYAEHGPHHPVGVHHDLTDEQLRRKLAGPVASSPCPRPEGLGEGAERLARALLAA